MDGTGFAQCLPDTDTEVCASGLIARLEEYWHTIRQGRAMPARRDIDPAGLRQLLPNVFLIDVVGRPARFRWRLTGTRIGSVERSEHTGKWIEETIRHEHDPLLAFCRLTVDERRPNCHAALRAELDGSERPLIRTLLPLSDDGQTVTMLLGGIDYKPAEILPLRRSP